jgi:diguanylate cyclase (GGDEF)-like protein
VTIVTGAGASVLVVDADYRLRRLVRHALELDGARVVEAASLVQARTLLGEGIADLAAVVVERHLPDGDGSDLVPELSGTLVVVTSDPGERDVPVPGAWVVARGDLSALTETLALPVDASPVHPRTAVEVLRAQASEIAADWAELCQWDPTLPPESIPPRPVAVVRAFSNAMERPQPIGWGADPAVERVAGEFAAEVGSLEIAIGELVCLREVLRRRLAPVVPPTELPETLSRMHMLIDRSLQVVAGHLADRLEQDALVDPLTGLLNRRALERDLRRERARASRYGRGFSVMVIDLDGLKAVNDSDGHLAGDLYLRSLGDALRHVLRSGDEAYRIGGDEFVVLLPETGESRADVVAARVLEAGAPPFSWGASTFGVDGEDGEELLDIADRRLYERRARIRGGAA